MQRADGYSLLRYPPDYYKNKETPMQTAFAQMNYRMRTLLVIALTALLAGLSNSTSAMTPEQIIAALQLPENSTGNIADAVEEATGARGWMSSDMKPIYDARIVGRAATALMRPVLKNDTRKYPNHILDILHVI